MLRSRSVGDDSLPEILCQSNSDAMSGFISCSIRASNLEADLHDPDLKCRNPLDITELAHNVGGRNEERMKEN